MDEEIGLIGGAFGLAFTVTALDTMGRQVQETVHAQNPRQARHNSRYDEVVAVERADERTAQLGRRYL